MIALPTSKRFLIRKKARLLLSLCFSLTFLLAAIPGNSQNNLTVRVESAIPFSVWDTATYAWSIWIKSIDPAGLSQGLEVRCHIDGRQVNVHGSPFYGMVSQGDSVRLAGTFTPSVSLFSGPQIHRLIWKVVTQQQEPLATWNQSVQLAFSQGPVAQGLGVFPGNYTIGLNESKVVLSAEVVIVNTDTDGNLFLPFTLLCAGPGVSPFIIAENITPPASLSPGESFTLLLPPVFVEQHALTGGVAHDIIVWPMRLPFIEPTDSAVFGIFLPATDLTQATLTEADVHAPLIQPTAEGKPVSGPDQLTSPNDIPELGTLFPSPDMPLIAPNPVSAFRANTYLHFTGAGGPTLIQVFDGFGRARLNHRCFLTQGAQKLLLDLPRMAPGLYWVRISDSMGERTAQFQVEKF